MQKYCFMLLTICMIFMFTACGNSKSKVVGEYDRSKLSGDFLKSGNEAYAIGANKDGMPIFKDTDKAYDQAIIDFVEGFAAIEEECGLEPISKKNWEEYKTYGWQLTTDNEEIRKQGIQITQFFDIYENSFK